MIHKSGHGPDPGTKSAPARADRPAPPPSMIAPPKPDAVPARWGRTDSMPAVAFGMVMPLPRPTKVMKPKKVHSDPRPSQKTSSDNRTPVQLISVPTSTIRFTPSRAEKRPEIKLPQKYPMAGAPKKKPRTAGVIPNTSVPT